MSQRRDAMTRAVRAVDGWARPATIGVTDRGWFGRTPLETHVVICGFARSGSSLLQAMIRSVVADAQTFPDETRALVAARRAVRNHRFLVTKSPGDTERVDTIRDYYAGRSAEVLFLVMIRDPLDVLTSRSPRDPTRYAFADPASWERRCDAVLALPDADDAVSVRYDDLVGSTDAVQQALTCRIGWTLHAPLTDYLDAAETTETLWGDFIESAMGGARTPEPSRDGRRDDPDHAARTVECRAAIPSLDDYTQRLEY